MIKDILNYDPDTGLITNAVGSPWRKLGAVAGTILPSGYRAIVIDGKHYYGHHIAVLFMTGSFPPKGKCVDHINGNRDDNRWINLRVTTMVVNGHNRHKLNKNNTSGFHGISFYKGRWQASIKIDRKVKNLGRFKTIEAAVAARDRAKIMIIGAANDNEPQVGL